MGKYLLSKYDKCICNQKASAIGVKFVFLCSLIAHLKCNISSMTTNKVVKNAKFFIISIVFPARHIYFHPQYCISYTPKKNKTLDKNI